MIRSTPEGASLVESTLRQLGVQNIRRTKRGFTANCPFHPDKNPSFSVMDSGFWKCWTGCGDGNFKQLVERLGGSVGDWRDTLKILGMELDNRDGYGKRTRRATKKFVNLPPGFNRYSLPDEVPAFIANRVSWDTIVKFGLGSSPNWKFKNRCVIPIVFKGKAVGYHARDTGGESRLKYLNPEDFDIKDYLFNYDSGVGAKELFIVEGAFSCMSMVEKGFPATVATFGTQFTPKQVNQIIELNPEKIVICFDRDPSKIKNEKEVGKSGQRAALHLGEILSPMMDVRIMPLPYKQDPNDCSQNVLQMCYCARVKYETLVDKIKESGK